MQKLLWLKKGGSFILVNLIIGKLGFVRYQREEAKIHAWLNLQTAKAEAQSRKLEVLQLFITFFDSFIPVALVLCPCK